MFKINPHLARLALRNHNELGFVIWSLLRQNAIVENLSSHYSKKSIRKLLVENSLNYTQRHINNILEQFTGIFWRVGKSKIYLISFGRVCAYFEQFTKPCDAIHRDTNIFIEIQPSKSIEAIRAEIYFAWFAQFSEKIISRATLTDLFGLSPEQQRAYEAKLGARLLVKPNYAHINGESYRENPQELPEYHFSFNFEREITTGVDLDSDFQGETQTVTAIQYQLPNTFFARPTDSEFIPAAVGSNRAKRAIRTLFGRVSSSNPTKRNYWLKRNEFERLAGINDLLRVAWQGKKSLWIIGNYF